MRYSNIKRFLSAALLIAFTAPSGVAYSTYGGYSSYNNNASVATTTELGGQPQLTQKNGKITLSLRDSDVKQVLRMFADKAGKNIVFHSSVTGKITLDMVDMPINDAFNLVLNIANLNYYDQNNTLVILSKDSEDNANFSKQEMMTFPIQYVSASKIANFLNKNVFGMNKTGLSGGDAATVNAATNELIVFGMPSDAAIVRKVIAQLDKEPSQRTFTVNHTTPAEMADMICNFLLPAHGSTDGSDSGSSGGGKAERISPSPGTATGGAAGIITGGAADAGGSDSGIKLGEGVVACSVSQSASGASNAPFDLQNIAVSYFSQRGTIMVMGGSESQLNMIEHFIKTNDIKQPQAFLEVSIVELTEDGSKSFQNVWDVQSRAWGVKFNGSSTSGGRVATPGGGDIIPLSKIVDEAVYNDKGQLIYTQGKVVDDFASRKSWFGSGTYISWQMNYLIESKKARVLATPKILITNGQESVIDLTEDYIEKVTSEFLSSASSGASTQGTVQKTYTIGEDKGIKITLTPFISPDGYVTLNIKPEYATEAGKVYSTGVTGEQEIGATLLNRRNLDLKNVRIKDGETLVIGGMIQEVETKTVGKIPILGDLPIIGAAFRSSSTSKGKGELVIMLTPKILVDGDSVADNL
jgi:type II secretory pathway component GspD/PulD (secretin)